eukprot:SAG22_NODE_79_length_21845_cov_17.798538_6_plen_100_part_00
MHAPPLDSPSLWQPARSLVLALLDGLLDAALSELASSGGSEMIVEAAPRSDDSLPREEVYSFVALPSVQHNVPCQRASSLEVEMVAAVQGTLVPVAHSG